MTNIARLHDKRMPDPEYRTAYDALEDQFTFAAVLIKARLNAGLT